MSAQQYFEYLMTLVDKIAHKQNAVGRNNKLKAVTKSELLRRGQIFWPKDGNSFPTRMLSAAEHNLMTQSLKSALDANGDRCLSIYEINQLGLLYDNYVANTIVVPEKIANFHGMLEKAVIDLNALSDPSIMGTALDVTIHKKTEVGEFETAFGNIRLWLGAYQKGQLPTQGMERQYERILAVSELALYRMNWTQHADVVRYAQELRRVSNRRQATILAYLAETRYSPLCFSKIHELLELDGFPHRDPWCGQGVGVEFIMALDLAAETGLRLSDSPYFLNGLSVANLIEKAREQGERRYSGSNQIVASTEIRLLTDERRYFEAMQVAARSWKEAEQYGTSNSFSKLRLLLAECYLQWSRIDKDEEHKLLAFDKYRQACDLATAMRVPLLCGARMSQFTAMVAEIKIDPLLKIYVSNP